MVPGWSPDTNPSPPDCAATGSIGYIITGTGSIVTTRKNMIATTAGISVRKRNGAKWSMNGARKSIESGKKKRSGKKKSANREMITVDMAGTINGPAGG